jgi:hypothetical protein
MAVGTDDRNLSGKFIPAPRPPPSPSVPEGCAPLRPNLRSYPRMGGVLTVDIDAKANAFAVQYHTPDRVDGWPAEPKPLPPSEVRVFALPSALNILDCRPCLAWWGPSTVSEVEASDAFPLWARVGPGRADAGSAK